MRALSIRQPFAELILRGIKTVEYRSRRARIIGQRFHIYASKGRGQMPLSFLEDQRFHGIEPDVRQGERREEPSRH